jgi:uncharacterized protein (DUF302 family)
VRSARRTDIELLAISVRCVPDLALRALDIDRQAGLLPPCTVVVRADGDGALVDTLGPAVLVRAPARLSSPRNARERLDAVQATLRGTTR